MPPWSTQNAPMAVGDYTSQVQIFFLRSIAYSARSEFGSLFSVGLVSNRAMLVATGVAFLLVLPLLYVPFLRLTFRTVPLGLNEWLVMLPLMFVSTGAAEITKLVLRRRMEGKLTVPARA